MSQNFNQPQEYPFDSVTDVMHRIDEQIECAVGPGGKSGMSRSGVIITRGENIPQFPDIELDRGDGRDIKITWKKTAKIPPIEVIRNQRIIDRIRQDLDLPDKVTDEEILARKGEGEWQLAQFGIAKDDLVRAINAQMEKLLKAFSLGRRK